MDYKLETYLKIARLYLEDGDPMQAEAFINRASLLQAETKSEELQVLYKVCYARVLDYRRKFIEAAQRYNELSYRTIVDEDERVTALRNALICTVLASAGQQRSRMLATLFKDERCQHLPAYGILEKMYLDRIIRRSELQVRPVNWYMMFTSGIYAFVCVPGVRGTAATAPESKHRGRLDDSRPGGVRAQSAVGQQTVQQHYVRRAGRFVGDPAGQG